MRHYDHTHETVAQVRECTFGSVSASYSPNKGTYAPVIQKAIARDTKPAYTQPKTVVPPATPSTPQVRDGYYAITEGYDKPHFFRVKNGRKPGVVFLDEQASDDLFPVRNRTRRTEILATIAKDPAKAMALYGELIGRCARCHRVLTDHKNPYFHMGLGPECGSK